MIALFSRRSKEEYFRPLHPLNRMRKKHPGKSREMPGCPLGWSAIVALGPGSDWISSFFRENRELVRRREDFRRYACGFGISENPRNRPEFCESGVIPGTKSRNPRISPIRKPLETSASPNHSKKVVRRLENVFAFLSHQPHPQPPKKAHERK